MREADTIQVLGRGTSVDFTIDDSVPFEIAERRLRDYLEVCRGLYSSGTVSVNVGRRILAPDQLSAIKEILDSETGLTVTRYWCAPETLQQAFYSPAYGGALAQRGSPSYGHVDYDAGLTQPGAGPEAEEFFRQGPANGVPEGRQLALDFADLQPPATTSGHGMGEPQPEAYAAASGGPGEMTQNSGALDYREDSEEAGEAGATHPPLTVAEGKGVESPAFDPWDDRSLADQGDATGAAENEPGAPESPDSESSGVEFPVGEPAVYASPEEEESAQVVDEWKMQPGWNGGDVLAGDLHLKNSPETGMDDEPELEPGQDAVPQDGRRGNQALIIKNTCRSGEVIRYQGDVVVFGDVNPGAVIIADGDIVVLGSLRGLAQAGADDDPKATILALNLETQRLQIGQHVGEAPRDAKRARSGNRAAAPQIAYLRRGSVFVAPFTRRREEYQGGVLYEG